MPTDLTGQSVRDLQEMLSVISWENQQIPSLTPDGKFGERTLEAVMTFQRDFYPPVTGVVNYETWTAIRDVYEDTLRRLDTPMALRILPHGRSTAGDRPLFQTMFDELSQHFPEFHTDDMADRTRILQRISRQPETGVLDRAAWDTLARLYALFVTRARDCAHEQK